MGFPNTTFKHFDGPGNVPADPLIVSTPAGPRVPSSSPTFRREQLLNLSCGRSLRFAVRSSA